MVDKLVIKEADVDDATMIIEYLNQVGCESNQLSFGKEGFNKSIKEEQEYIKKMKVDDCASMMFLGFIEHELVSIFTLTQLPKARFCHIGEIGCSVKKQYWNQKIASRMMEHLIMYARQSKQLRILSLEVFSNNEAGVALYQKFGFTIYGTFKERMHLNGCYYDSYFMNLYLSKDEEKLL